MNRLVKMAVSLCLSAFIGLALLGNACAWELQWFGHSSFKITTPSNKIILIDPFISNNPKTPKGLKDIKKIGNVDLILLTHAHGDHIGDTAEIVELTDAKVASNADLGHTLGLLDIVDYDQLIRFNKGGAIEPLQDIKVTMVHAEHSSAFVHTDTKTGVKSTYPGGEPVGYIIELENGYKIYHAGDTALFGDMKFIGQYYQPDIALLPIGGHFTMDPAHAAYAIKNLLNTANVIPIHYGTSPLLKGTPEQLKQALGSFQAKVIEMAPGEKRTF